MTVARLTGSAGSVSIGGGQVTINGNGAGSLLVGQTGVGTLLVTNATLVATNLAASGFQVGRNSGAQGSMTLASGGQIVSDGGVLVGAGNNATTATGTVLVSGGTWTHNGILSIGSNGVGTVTILGGTNVFSGGITMGTTVAGLGNLAIGGGTVTCPGTAGGLMIGDAGTGVVTVTGGSWRVAGGQIARSANSSGRLTISGGQVTVDGGGANSFLVGQSSRGSIDVSGGLLVVTNLTPVGWQLGRNSNAGCVGSVNLSGNGQIVSDGMLHVGYGTTFVSGPTGLIVQTGGTWTHNGMLWVATNAIGSIQLTGGTMTVTDLQMGYTASSKGTVTVSGDGTRLVAGTIMAGLSVSSGHRVLVTSNGLIEANSLRVGSGNVITNVGGIFQFTIASPTVTAARVGIADGTIAFRGITDANIRENWSGALTNMAFRGANTFRLDAASTTTSGQDYTFANGLGATNYARLELLNGSTYRGGDVTIGSGGTLTATGAVSAIPGNLTFQTGSTYRVWLGSTGVCSQVAVGQDVSLGGVALDVHLTGSPVMNRHYAILVNNGANAIAGQPQSNTVMATVGGTNFELHVLKASGDGNDLAIVYAGSGGVFAIR